MTAELSSPGRAYVLPGTLVALASVVVLGAGCGGKTTPGPAPASDGPALFARVAPVFQHPRCMNCHPSDDVPRQGMNGLRHFPDVRRGPEDQGVPAMRCRTCHQDENQDHAGVPGAPRWQLAPRSMGWHDRSAGDICRAITDPTKNGRRTLSALVAHLTDDPLVAWAWNPGKGREPPAMARDEFVRAIRAWAAAGAGCPP